MEVMKQIVASVKGGEGRGADLYELLPLSEVLNERLCERVESGQALVDGLLVVVRAAAALRASQQALLHRLVGDLEIDAAAALRYLPCIHTHTYIHVYSHEHTVT